MTHLEILALLDSATLAQMVLDAESALAAANARALAAEAAVSEYAAELDLALKRFGEKQSAWLAEKRRALAAEAKLAAVPVEAWRTLLSGENVSVESDIRAWNAVRSWLAQRGEVQP